eukprot:15457237-Alexandrium_andersonii.AAC.1
MPSQELPHSITGAYLHRLWWPLDSDATMGGGRGSRQGRCKATGKRNQTQLGLATLASCLTATEARARPN